MVLERVGQLGQRRRARERVLGAGDALVRVVRLDLVARVLPKRRAALLLAQLPLARVELELELEYLVAKRPAVETVSALLCVRLASVFNRD